MPISYKIMFCPFHSYIFFILKKKKSLSLCRIYYREELKNLLKLGLAYLSYTNLPITFACL